jgi:hypothetical protein
VLVFSCCYRVVVVCWIEGLKLLGCWWWLLLLLCCWNYCVKSITLSVGNEIFCATAYGRHLLSEIAAVLPMLVLDFFNFNFNYFICSLKKKL